jgi:hypothetical protein
MMMALVASFSAILSRQLDTFSFDTIYSPDMRPVGSHDFHVFFDVINGWHSSLPRFASMECLIKDIGSKWRPGLPR